jgi:protein-S-isoprenylcysteine O-methyltransferase Ste14
MPQKNLYIKVMIRLLIGFIFIAGFLFGTAGTFNWPEAWLYIIIQFSLSITFYTWLKKNNPELLKDRLIFRKKTAKSWDKAITTGSLPFLIALLIVPGLDAVRYQWSQVSLAIKTIGFLAIMKENAYLSRVVEIQKERQHKVITTGPYKYVRHPMYVGIITLGLCLPLALGSLYGLIPAVFLVIAVIIRTYLEDKTLYEELPGYKEYAKKTKYRLLPGVW